MDATYISDEGKATLVILLSYDGAGFSGFAKQKDPSLRTVQGTLEGALATLFSAEVPTVCAGRTDAGVHALGQLVSCEVDAATALKRNVSQLRISLNALTPDDIAVRSVRYAPCGFSARFDALRREYRYRIVTGGAPPLFLRNDAWWHKGALDIGVMQRAADLLVGEHDFKSFCKAASAEGKNTVRCIEVLEVFCETQLGEEHIVVRVVGNAFLHSMVRTLVGTLAQVGEGRKEPAWVADVLAARDRSAAGETAPACGLTFWQVDYPEGLFVEQL